MNIKIKIMNMSIKCKVMDTSTGKKIYSMLPIKSKVNTWGKEVYFYIPKNSIKPEKNAKEVFNLGEIALEPRKRHCNRFWSYSCKQKGRN